MPVTLPSPRRLRERERSKEADLDALLDWLDRVDGEKPRPYLLKGQAEESNEAKAEHGELERENDEMEPTEGCREALDRG